MQTANGDPLPAWLTFDDRTATFGGRPDQEANLEIEVVVTVDKNASGSGRFRLTVEP